MSVPDGMEALHGDDNPVNNYLSNLSWDTHSQNRKDRKRNNPDAYSSEYLHVVEDEFRKRWVSQLIVNGHRIGFGSFKDPESAARAVDDYISQHSLNRELNFPR